MPSLARYNFLIDNILMKVASPSVAQAKSLKLALETASSWFETETNRQLISAEISEELITPEHPNYI